MHGLLKHLPESMWKPHQNGFRKRFKSAVTP